MDRKYSLAIAGVGLALCGLAPIGLSALEAVQSTERPTVEAAEQLERKIRAIEAADSQARGGPDIVQVSELELESYALYGLVDDLAVRIDAVDLEIRSGELAATVDMFVDADLVASQPIAGPLFEGEHSVFFEGGFEARGGRGTFDLQRVRVDGITVPVFLVKALLESLDDPVDLDAPIQTPLGIDDVVLTDRAVSVTY